MRLRSHCGFESPLVARHEKEKLGEARKGRCSVLELWHMTVTPSLILSVVLANSQPLATLPPTLDPVHSGFVTDLGNMTLLAV